MSKESSNRERFAKKGSVFVKVPFPKYLDTIHGIPDPDDRRFEPKVFTVQSSPQPTSLPTDTFFLAYEDGFEVEYEDGGFVELEIAP